MDALISVQMFSYFQSNPSIDVHSIHARLPSSEDNRYERCDKVRERRGRDLDKVGANEMKYHLLV